MKKILESKMKVRFHDCDPFSHLNNSRYIDYMVTARGDQLIDNYEFDIYELARKQGLGWVSAQTQISYLSPAHLMEEVVIQTQLTGFSEKVLYMEAIMWNHDKSLVKAIMWSSLVHYHLSFRRSEPHNKDLIDLFQQVVNPFPDKTTFEERVSYFRKLK